MGYIARVSANDAQERAAAAAVPRLKFGNWGKPFTIAGRIGFRILSLRAVPAATKPLPSTPPGE